jgi:hypothetical protein
MCCILQTITGLLRRDDAEEAARKYPIAVIPAGLENTFAHKLYGDCPDEYKFIAQAGMAVVRHRIVPKHVIQYQTIRKLQNVSKIVTFVTITNCLACVNAAWVHIFSFI